jgi:hypothetical protein
MEPGIGADIWAQKPALPAHVPERDELDFVLDLSENGATRAKAEGARLGLWRLSFGNPGELEEFAAFWELLQSTGGIEVALRRFSESDPFEGTILQRGLFPVTSHSYGHTIERARAGCVDFPLLACRSLLGDSVLRTLPEDQHAREARRHLDSGLPNTRTVVLFLVRLLLRKLQWMLQTGFHRVEWNSGTTSQSEINPTVCSTIQKVDWLRPEIGNGHFYEADPFIWRCQEGYVLLTETMLRREQRGVISAWRITKGQTARLGVALDEKTTHLSYPYLVKVDEAMYCIPEQHEAKAIVVYRATEFPTRWVRVGELISDIRVVDPTLFRHEPYWWLACTEVWPKDSQEVRVFRTRPDSVCRLHLWYADALTGPWKAHSQNPVKIDARCGRGAGTPFYYEGNLIRPSQDCSRTYGAKVVFNRIVRLTPTEFEEETAGELLPDPTGPYPEGLHNISLSGDVAAIDGCRLVFDPSAWLGRIRNRRRFGGTGAHLPTVAS